MFQKLIFKPRSKSSKNCIKETTKNKKKKTTERECEDSKILNDRGTKDDKTVAERGNGAQVEAAREGEKEKKRCEEDKKIEGGIEISMDTATKKDGADKSEGIKAENCTEEEVKMTLDGGGSKENGEPSGNEDIKEVSESVVTVEASSETKEKEAGAVQSAMENGIEADREKDEGEEDQIKTEELAEVEVTAKETVADPQATNQSPAEAQE